MNYMLCRNRVRSFDQWKRVFDNHANAHRAAGLRLVHIWREMDNPCHIFFLFEVEEMERARAFLDSSDAATSAREAGLIEGDFRFFSESMGYGPPTEAKTASARVPESATTMKDPNSPTPVEAVNTSVPPELMKSPEPEKSPALSESVKAEEPVKSVMPPATMKGPERVVKSAPPLEPVEGWEPVENWPPAEVAAESTRQPAREQPPKRGRWVRIKY
jgi:hypothetical protein